MSSVSRRTFLRTSAVLAAGSAVRPARGQTTRPSELIRAAVIGCRNRGWQDAKRLHHCGRFEVVALCDCDATMRDVAMKQLDGYLPNTPRFEQDFRKLLDDPSIDVIVNATPDHWHALITVMALEAGKHVYLEKPASYNIADGKAMLAALKRHPDRVVTIGTQQRSGRHFFDAKAFIDAGGLGKVGFARAWLTGDRGVVERIPDSDPPATLDYEMWTGPAPMRPYNANLLHYNWHFMHANGTGDMGNWGAHWLDVIRWFLDLDVPKGVSASGGTFVVHDAKEWPDTHTVLYEFDDLTVVWEQRHWTTFQNHGRSTGVEIDGEKGTMIIDRGGWTFHPREGEPEKHGGSELERAHVTNFADCITGSATPAASLDEGHKTAIMCHLGNIALLTKRRIAFDAATQTIPNDREANALCSRVYRGPWKLPVS